MLEIINKRTERAKTFDLGNRKKRLESHIGAIHYKEDYEDSREDWKDIDLIWEGNQITKAPFILTYDDKKLTVYNRKTKETSTIELLEIGGKKIKDKEWIKTKANAKNPDVVTLEDAVLDTDLEINVENDCVRFTRVLKSDKAPKEAKFKVTGNGFQYKAIDSDGKEVKVVSTLVGDILTEEIEPDDKTVYPVRVDPTWQVAASTDDCTRGYDADYFYTDYGFLPLGYTSVSNKDLGSAARFLNVNIPAGSTIDTSVLILTAGINCTEEVVNSRIRCEKNTAPVTFSDSTDFDARTWTTAYVNWDAIPQWSTDESGADTTSTDFATPLQEVADLGGLTHIVVEWDDWEKRSDQENNHYRYSRSYDGSTTKAPVLSVTYTESSTFVPKFMGIT